MSKVVLDGFVLVPDENLAAVAEELPVHIELTRQEEGCLVFEMSQDKDNPNRFNLYEEFVDSAAFEFHRARVRSSKWGQVAVNVERHYEIRGID